MRPTLLLVVSMAVCLLAAAPDAVACSSVHGVKAYHGHATVDFSAQASGQDSANGGTYSASLERDVSEVSSA